MSNKNPPKTLPKETATEVTKEPSVSTLELVYRSVDTGGGISNATGLTVGSLTLVSTSCPPGLEALCVSDTLYLKPYSGPNVIAHVTRHKRFEILNGEGERIYMLTDEPRSSKYDTAEDERRNKYGVRMVVKNHFGEPVFEYYGNSGQYIKTGSDGSRSWGVVTRNWKASKCSRCPRCSFPTTLAFDVVIFNNKFTEPEIGEPKHYRIEGTGNSTMFPSSSARKLYYGTFECDIKVKIPEVKGKRDAAVPAPTPEIIEVGKVSSNLYCSALGMELPGIAYPKKMNVYHKAVLFGCLLVNVIRT